MKTENEMTAKPYSSVLSDGARRILGVATVLFAEAGVDGVSIAQIAREAGVGKATVFHHFPSKEALYQAVLWQVSERAEWLIEDQSGADMPLLSWMTGFIRQQIRLLAENDELLKLVRRELIQGTPDGVQLISEVFSGPFHRLKAQLEERKASGEVAEDVDTGLMAWWLLDAGVHFHEGCCVLSRMPGFLAGQDADIYSQNMARMLASGCLQSGQGHERDPADRVIHSNNEEDR